MSEPLQLKVQQFYSKLLWDIQASHLVPKAKQRLPTKETNFVPIYLYSFSISHHPQLMTTHED